MAQIWDRITNIFNDKLMYQSEADAQEYLAVKSVREGVTGQEQKSRSELWRDVTAEAREAIKEGTALPVVAAYVHGRAEEFNRNVPPAARVDAEKIISEAVGPKENIGAKVAAANKEVLTHIHWLESETPQAKKSVVQYHGIGM
jgi:hypothetical protein